MNASPFELLHRLRPLFASRRTPVFLVGGAVRDALLGRAAYDLDFVVTEDAISLAFTVADHLRAAAYAMDRERDIGRVVLGPKIILDFARFRGPDLEADLRARDFTVNAMAVDATTLDAIALAPAAATPHTPPAALIDPCHGFVDMQRRLLRQTHAGAIAADPVRALRAVRLCWQLGFVIDPQTAAAARQEAPNLQQTSVERVRDEFLKLLRGPAPDQAILQMGELELLGVVLPEIEALRDVPQSAPHREPVLAHSIHVLSCLLQVEAALMPSVLEEKDPVQERIRALLQPFAAALYKHLERPVDGMLDGRTLLRLAALFHDVGKKQTATVEEDGRIRFFGHDKEGAAITVRRLRQLRLSNEAILHVRDTVAAHMRPLHLANSVAGAQRLSRRAAYRYFRTAGASGLDVALLTLADHLATHDGCGPEREWQRLTSVMRELLSHYFEKYEETVAPPPILDGHELITTLNLKPGPQIGRLLHLIEEAQAAGEIQTKEEAIELARKRLEIRD